MISASGRFSVYSHGKTNYNMIIDIGHNRKLLLAAVILLSVMSCAFDSEGGEWLRIKATISAFTHDPIEIDF